jgi:hypothetical protein
MPQSKPRVKFICKCGQLKMWTDADFQVFVRTVGRFRLQVTGKLPIFGPVCDTCGEPPKH